MASQTMLAGMHFFSLPGHQTLMLQQKVMVVLQGYPRWPDSHDLSECHHLYCLGKYIVACHLPRGSKLRWCGDIDGKLPSASENCALAEASNLMGCKEYTQQDLLTRHLAFPRVQTGHGALELNGAGGYLKYNCLSQAFVNCYTDYTLPK